MPKYSKYTSDVFRISGTNRSVDSPKLFVRLGVSFSDLMTDRDAQMANNMFFPCMNRIQRLLKPNIGRPKRRRGGTITILPRKVNGHHPLSCTFMCLIFHIVRVKGAGQYQFSLDEQRRAEQQAALKSQRHETELARAEAGRRGGVTAAQEARKKKLEQRKAMIEAKRAQLFDGEKEVQMLKEERKAREADEFLNTLQKEWEGQ